jgi:hypothetical protein
MKVVVSCLGSIGEKSALFPHPQKRRCLILSNRFVLRQRILSPRFGIADGMPLLGQWGSPGSPDTVRSIVGRGSSGLPSQKKNQSIPAELNRGDRGLSAPCTFAEVVRPVTSTPRRMKAQLHHSRRMAFSAPKTGLHDWAHYPRHRLSVGERLCPDHLQACARAQQVDIAGAIADARFRCIDGKCSAHSHRAAGPCCWQPLSRAAAGSPASRPRKESRPP